MHLFRILFHKSNENKKTIKKIFHFICFFPIFVPDDFAADGKCCNFARKKGKE